MERGEIPIFDFLECWGYEGPIRTFGSGGVMKAPFGFLEWWGMKAPFELFGVVGYCRPLDLLGGWGIVDPIGFLGRWGIVDPIGSLVEGGIFSLECPRATAVFGQTVLVWSGVGGF